MSREEAIDILQHITTIIPSNDVSMDDVDTALEMAIQALSQEPKTDKPMCDRNICLNNEYNGIGCEECVVNKAEQEPCDDVVSRQDVLEAMCNFCPNYNCKSKCARYIHMTLLPPVTQKPIECDDAISREAVLEAVSEGCQELRGVYGRCEELINVLPSVTHKSGKWEFHCQHWSKCSICGYADKFADKWNYCPNCGAKMENVEKSLIDIKAESGE